MTNNCQNVIKCVKTVDKMIGFLHWARSKWYVDKKRR